MHELPSFPDAQRLRDYFTNAGYTRQGLIDRLGSIDPPLPQLRNLPRFLYQTRAMTEFDVLARWFFTGVPVSAKAARAVVPAELLELCQNHGLLQAGQDELIPQILLAPHGDFLIASDLYQKLAAADHYDHVLTVNPSANYLLNFTLRQPVEATLDLGTGCGIQALMAAAHSRQVVATDLNPRASWFTAFNARLNGLTNIECLTGDFWTTVQDRQFDLIICNPPFVLAPSKDYLYRDNEFELDQLCRQLVREAPRYLKPGGFFQMICEWAQIEAQPWQARLSEWFEGTDCDVWVLKNYTQPPSWYAQTRLREMLPSAAEIDNASYQQWMDYYHAHHIEVMHGGLIAMRRRTEGTPWLKLEDRPDNLAEPFGEVVLQRFKTQDFLETHTNDQALLAATLQLSPAVRLQKEYRATAGQWQPVSMELSLTTALSYTAALEESVADFIIQFDGNHTLQALIQALADRVKADFAEVQSECLRVVRLMIERGFLVPL